MKNEYKKKRNLFTLLILFSFILSVLPGGMRDIRAEELKGEEPVKTLELVAKVIWTGISEEMTIPGTTLKLMSGKEVVESIEVTDGSLEVKFAPVDEFDADGNVILYTLEQEPLENYKTEIREFVIENTFIPPVVEEPVEVKSESIVEDDPKVEEPAAKDSVVEEVIDEEPEAQDPVVEEPEDEKPAAQAPIVEEPVAEEPEDQEEKLPVEESVNEAVPVKEPEIAENPVVAETPEAAEAPAMEEPVEIIPDEAEDLSAPSGPDRVIPSQVTSVLPTDETLGIPEEAALKITERSFSPMVKTSESSMVTPTIPGQVTIDKFATPVPGLVNTWDITLRIEGMDTRKSSDIVLVMDRSGSMSGSKLTGAKNAAKAFVDAMAYKPNTRIAVVSFASAYQTATTVSTNQNFLSPDSEANIEALKIAIDDLDALGGTNTQAGIRRGAELLSGSIADIKNLILLSDGEPTQSYEVVNVGAKLISHNQSETVEAGGNPYQTTVSNLTRSSLTAGDYNYDATVGAGTAAYTRIGTRGSNYYSHGNSAIAQAAMFKNAGGGRVLWTIALETTSYGNQVLSNIASPDKAFTASTSHLNTIFLQIAGSINSAAKDSVVIDPMAAGFEIPVVVNSNITKSQGTHTYVNRVLTWNVGDLTQSLSPGTDIKAAWLKYRVTINDEILSLPIPDDGRYKTNGDAKVTYKDSGNMTKELAFPVPEVNPIFLNVTKVLMDASGNVISDPIKQFPIRIMSDAADGDTIYPEYNETYPLIPDQMITKTSLRLADTYTVSENAPEYDVSIKVNGVATNTFTVEPPGSTSDSGQPDILVEVTNKEKPLGKLTLKKILLDAKNKPIVGDQREFIFDITGPDHYSESRTLKGGESVTISGLKYGTYNVTERDPGTGFKVTYNPVQGDPPYTKATVILGMTNKEGIVTVTNKESTSSLQLLKTDKRGVPLKDAEFELYRKVVKTTTGAVKFITLGGGAIYGIRIEDDTWPDGRLKTGSDGKTQRVDGLEAGDYFVIEVVAPQGYRINEYPIEFEILVTTQLNIVTIKNERAPAIPNTGGMGTLLFSVLGLGIMSGALLSFKKHNHIIRGKGDNVMKRNRLFTILFTFLLLFVFTVPGMAKAEELGDPVETIEEEYVAPVGVPVEELKELEVEPEVQEKGFIKSNCIVIHKMELFEKCDVPGTLLKNHNGTELLPGALDDALGEDNYKGLDGVKFRWWRVESTDTVESLEDKTVEELDDLFFWKDTVGPTTNGGKLELSLLDGYYYFREVVTPEHVVEQIAVPFILGLPVMNAEGTGFLRDKIHIYPKNLTVRGAVELTKKDDSNKPLAGAKFKLFKGVAPNGVWYDPEGPAVPMEYTTDASGKIFINNLPKGSYYFVEQSVPAPWLLNTTAVSFTIDKNEKKEVVCVSLKNFKGPEIDKWVLGKGNIKASGDFQQKIPYFIYVNLPEDILNYTVLYVTDTIDSKLDYKNSLKVEYSTTNGLGYAPMPTSKYTAIEPAIGGDGLLKIVFHTTAQLKTSHGFKYTNIKISFDAAINDTAIMGKCIENRASVTFNNRYLPTDKVVVSEKVCAFTGGKNFLKWDKKLGKGLAGAEFAVRNSSNKFLKIAGNGEYLWVSNIADAHKFVSDANGYFNVKGLDYSLGFGGTYYWLVETKAPMGPDGYPYNIIEGSLKFLVNGTSFYTHPQNITDFEAAPTADPGKIYNELGPKIPQTGGIGSAVFGVIGAALMGSALMFNKKKKA